MSDDIRIFGSLVRHARSEHADEIRLDLKIYIICVRVVHPMTRFGSRTPVEDIVTSGLIGVPELVWRVGEFVGIEGLRRSDVVFRHHFEKCEVHIDIVVKPRIFNKCIRNIVLVPDNRFSVLHESALELEFRRTSVGAAYSLGEPPSANLVHNHIPAESKLGSVFYATLAACAEDKCEC